MFRSTSRKYGKELIVIHPGELYATTEDEIIGTLLGSCVAVCLFDSKNGIAGMNHFMLPGRISHRDIFSDRSARYGITAIHELLNEVEKKGAEKKNLIAKIFGGGHVLEIASETVTIPIDNIRLAKIMMEIEDIPIQQTDVGENFTRKLLLDVKSGKVYLRKTTKKEVYNKIAGREIEFARRSFHDK